MPYIYDMVNLGTARLAGVIIGLGLVAIAGINVAFAQTTSTGQPCGAQAYAYIGCAPLATAQMYGAAIVGGVIIFSIVIAAASGPRLERAWT